MALRSFARISLILAPLFVGGTVLAQEPGVTSGPESESGQNVEPSTAIQKEDTGRSSTGGTDLQGSPSAAGAPGVEGKPGTQSGESQRPPPAPSRGR